MTSVLRLLLDVVCLELVETGLVMHLVVWSCVGLEEVLEEVILEGLGPLWHVVLL